MQQVRRIYLHRIQYNDLTPFTRYNRLYRVYKHSTGCQTRFTTGLTNGFIVYRAGCQTGLYNPFDNRVEQTGLTTGCIVYTNIQPDVKPVSQPV